MSSTRIILLCTAAFAGSAAAAESPQLDAYTKLPLSFEANRGQTDPRAKYLARGLGYTTFLTADGAVLSFGGPHPAVLRLNLKGASTVEPAGLDELAGRSNYFIGNKPAKWRTGIANFARVRYPEIYPGVDLVYHGNQRQLEYDFVVSPGASTAAIRLRFSGARRIRLDRSGDLVLDAGGREVRMHKPVVYQSVDDSRREIDGRYVLRGSQVSFEIGSYDRGLPLVIDPLIVLRATYLGGMGTDLGYAIAADQAGLTYVTGSTASINFPLVACAMCAPGGGLSDAFVSVFNPVGGFLYSTFLGGGGTDVGRGIAVSQQIAGGPLQVFVTGSTTGGFPLRAPVQPVYGGGPSDAFVTSLSPVGIPVYSTYLGGAREDIGYGISVDSVNNAYITGSTNSLNFPRFKCMQCANAGGTDAFVTALPLTGRPFLYSTYLGGAGNDTAYGISAEVRNEVAITGTTNSLNYPVVTPCAQCFNNGGTDAFISFLNFVIAPGPQPGPPILTWSTYWGGPGNENSYSISVDNLGSGWITGSTDSRFFPVLSCAQCLYGGGPTDAILVHFERIPLVDFSDFIGGARADVGYGVAGDPWGSAFVTGVTNSANFPMMACFQCALGGGSDAFVAEYTPAVRLFSTFLGGSMDDSGQGIAVNPRTRSVYVAGTTSSPNFPTRPPCTQCAMPGGISDAFVAAMR